MAQSGSVCAAARQGQSIPATNPFHLWTGIDAFRADAVRTLASRGCMNEAKAIG